MNAGPKGIIIKKLGRYIPYVICNHSKLDSATLCGLNSLSSLYSKGQIPAHTLRS